jgi:hypothetical protein
MTLRSWIVNQLGNCSNSVIKDKPSMQPLNRDEFAVALKKGLGRAWWHVASYGLDDVADLVLEACLHTQSYDPQCESSRAAWLFEMFGQTPHYPKFHEAILSALTAEKNSWDVEQLCGLAKEMAAHGDEQARQALRVFVLDKASSCGEDDVLGAEEWIELAGVEGVIEIAKACGQQLLSNPSAKPNVLVYWLDEIGQSYQAALLQSAKIDPAIKAYWSYLEESGEFTPSQSVDREMIRQQTRLRIREQRPLGRILDEAKNSVGEFPGRYATFGHYATPEELETVYAALLAAVDDAARVRLLWVFRRAPLPQLNDIVLDWAVDGDEKLRAAAIATVAQNTDERIHALARAKAAAGQLTGADSEALSLFVHNYQGEDAQIISSALTEITPATDWEAHDLGWSLIDLAEQHADPNLAAALRWAYENTPCTNCRYRIVKLLDQLQALGDALLQECLHDAEEDTRAVARERLARVK